jgi:hypothetical protein
MALRCLGKAFPMQRAKWNFPHLLRTCVVIVYMSMEVVFMSAKTVAKLLYLITSTHWNSIIDKKERKKDKGKGEKRITK